MNDHLFAAIMAGGVGSRLWPRSRSATPKQFLDLVSSCTMLQETVERIEPLVPLDRVLVVASEEYRDMVREQVPGLPAQNLLVEPERRGTAPCIGLAAVAIQARDPAATMAVFPADHLVVDAAGFRQAIAAAAQIARDGYLVTLGITPSFPHTGYGYIQRGELLGLFDGQQAFRVRRFTEKPDEARARAFVDSGEYYWNGGIFIWQVGTILGEMARFLPDLHTVLHDVSQIWGSADCRPVLERTWKGLTQTTIDYGVMEKAEKVVTVPVDIGWDDVGDWANLSSLLQADADGNVLRGRGKTLILNSRESYVYAAAGRLVAAIGLEDFVVVDTADALLICPKSQAQAVRDIVEELQAQGLEDYL